MLNHDRYIKHATNFQQTFGYRLRVFWSSLGFDVVAFDETVVKPADGVSCAQAIEKRWGADAVAMIHDLIG